VPAEVWEKIKDHPCYSVEAHHFFARMHVAVAPACNVQCHYCNRKYDCANESRPGVVSERLSPEQAVRKVMAVAARLPQLAVVGIAGPGDALANPKATFETCDRIAERLPDLKLCLSTNGLALPDHVDAIRSRTISHVTVTLNAIDPAIAARIYEWIGLEGRRRTGVEAARLLIERQLRGIDLLVAAGVLVKINSVLIPGINDSHLADVNAEVQRRGVFLHNIMPLISDPAHGTRFGLSGQRGPTPAELKELQDRLAGGATLMKHCRQCRADAVGMLGDDCGQDYALSTLADDGADAADIDPAPRAAYRAFVEGERAERSRAADGAAAALMGVPGKTSMLIAVCTKGGGRINLHFGKASEFQIYEADHDGVRLIGHRRASHYCQGGFGEDEALERIITALDGVGVILCAKIGDCPRERLQRAGIRAIDDFAFEYIETAAAALLRADAGCAPAPAKRA
jgi:nitrogen fixation protein NifB